MPDLRVFCRESNARAAELTLDADESHHLVTVNRARRGDPVVAFNGEGLEWRCELVQDKRNAAVLRVMGAHARARPPFSITLAQALPKGTAMDGIIRKATEIGAREIIPLETERTQVHFDADRSDRKREKWQTAALEAAKQCGNPFLPTIAPVMPLSHWLTTASAYDMRLIASLESGAVSLKQVLADFHRVHGRAPERAVWLVGPEGDFAPGEWTAAKSAGFTPVTLGPLVLRCETAATFALSILSYELQSSPADERR